MANPVNAGSILRRTFPLFARGVGPFLTISCLVHTPLLLAAVLLAALQQVTPVAELAVTLASSLLFTPLASAALIHGVFRHLRGRSATVQECLRVAFTRPLAIVGLALLVAVVTGIGSALCIIPGIIAACGLFVAVPALVVEKLGVGNAFNRSWTLTENYRFSIFAVLLVFGLMEFAFGVALA